MLLEVGVYILLKRLLVERDYNIFLDGLDVKHLLVICNVVNLVWVTRKARVVIEVL
jgi:hypothetical protein